MGSRPHVGMGNRRPSGRPLPPTGGERTAARAGAGGRAHALGPRWLLGALSVLALAALAVAGSAAAGLLGSGSAERVGGRSAPSAARYGGLPSWLPKPKVAVDRIVTASAAHPALAIQGNTVNVMLPAGHVLATAVGPETPEQGRFPVPATSPCTFVVTFAGASRVVPLDPSSFTLVDELGHVRHPRVTTMDGGAPPAQIEPGRTLSLKLYDVLPTGDGGLEWTPAGAGPHPTVAWDFDVEID